MVKSVETSTSTKMSVRRSTTTNGFVQPRSVRPRRRNAVANIFSELNEGDIRALRQQAQDMLHPAAMGASPPGSSADSSSSEDLNHVNQPMNLQSGQRRRRNALHDIGIGIDHAELQQLREQAQDLHHPATMMTTPPGAPCGGTDEVLWSTPRSMSMLSAAAGVAEMSIVPDETGASHTQEFSEFSDGPCHIFTVESVTDAVHPHQGTHFPGSIFSTDGASSQRLSSSPSSDAITTITETDGNIFRERIARSSMR